MYFSLQALCLGILSKSSPRDVLQGKAKVNTYRLIYPYKEKITGWSSSIFGLCSHAYVGIPFRNRHWTTFYSSERTDKYWFSLDRKKKTKKLNKVSEALYYKIKAKIPTPSRKHTSIKKRICQWISLFQRTTESNYWHWTNIRTSQEIWKKFRIMKATTVSIIVKALGTVPK